MSYFEVIEAAFAALERAEAFVAKIEGDDKDWLTGMPNHVHAPGIATARTILRDAIERAKAECDELNGALTYAVQMANDRAAEIAEAEKERDRWRAAASGIGLVHVARREEALREEVRAAEARLTDLQQLYREHAQEWDQKEARRSNRAELTLEQVDEEWEDGVPLSEMMRYMFLGTRVHNPEKVWPEICTLVEMVECSPNVERPIFDAFWNLARRVRDLLDG